MQYTTNYNLITVEGTDVVNPLVQMNPNFTDIDAAMFANKQATIGSASEIVSGTVHAITRANTDSNYFRYTATGNWTAGDTMSVDGTTVSVYLTDGTTPGTGSYVINSEVFGMISGSRVTLFLTNPITTLAATDVTFDPTGTTLDPSDTDVDSAIRSLAGRVTKLWENPAPSSPFAAQNITLNSSDYDFLIVFSKYGNNIASSITAPKGFGVFLNIASATSDGAYGFRRSLNYIDDTTLGASDNYSAYGTTTATVDNTVNIPVVIYGIKI